VTPFWFCYFITTNPPSSSTALLWGKQWNKSLLVPLPCPGKIYLLILVEIVAGVEEAKTTPKLKVKGEVDISKL